MRFYAKLGFGLLGPGNAPTPYVIATLDGLEIHLWQTKGSKKGLAYLRVEIRWTASMPGLRKPCPRNAVRQV